MYQNLMRRISATSSRKPLSVHLEPMPLNEKLAFVESVCSNMIDSRFGPGRGVPVIYRLTEQPELERAVLFDLTAEGPVPSYTILPDSEAARRYMYDALRREIQTVRPPSVSIHIQNLPPENQGRGSP